MIPTKAPTVRGFTPVVWGEDGAPRSARFDDVYYSTADGLAETRAVFLDGCGLPDAWSGRSAFTVGELGFGSGLNIAALLQLWRRTHEPGARLNIFSIEAFPVSAADARRALSAWPELDEIAGLLADRWPRAAAGFHRVDLPECAASLDLAIMDAGEALAQWGGQADAWFLDGFAPSRNPDMWREAVLAGIAQRSAPGARLATFTVAGVVRRGLAAQGFAVDKRPGFGRKSERLEARDPRPLIAAPTAARSVAIIGAGIAGASLARAFLALGVATTVFDASDASAGASGNPAALVAPRLDAGGGPVAALFAQAMARARDLIAVEPGVVIAEGAVQLESGPKDPDRFDRIAQDPLFADGAVVRLDSAEAGRALGEVAHAGGLGLTESLVVEPERLTAAWLAGAERRRVRVDAIAPHAEGWGLYDADGAQVGAADIVCLAAGPASAALAEGLPLRVVRGQVSVVDGDVRPAPALWGGYLIPTRSGFLFGATHDRDDPADDVRAEDHARNLAELATVRPILAADLAPVGLTGRAGHRAVTPDFLPLAGAVSGPAGVFVLSGLGSRGFCAAPLLAEHVAALATGAPSPLPASLSDLVDPARFEKRRNRRLARSMTRR